MSSQPGSHQAWSPSSVTTAGAMTRRTIRTSIRIARPRPRPNIFAITSGWRHEGQEDRGHDQAGEQDHLADPRQAVDHAARAARRPRCRPRGCARAGRRCSPCSSPNRIANSITGMNETIGTPLSTPSRLAPKPSWKTRDDDAVGRADRQQVEDRRDERDPERAEGHDQQQHREADHDRDEQRQARGDLVREVLEAGGVAADVDLQRRAGDGASGSRPRAGARAGRSCASSCGAVFGIAKIVAISPSWLTACAGATVRHAGRARRRPSGACRAAPALSARALGDVDREQERAVGARAERLAEPVVGDALDLGLGLVAVVGLAEPQLRDRARRRPAG